MNSDIPGYEGIYTISKDGLVFSVERQKEVPSHICGSGYYRTVLKKRGYSNHRLVAMTYLDTWDPVLHVNHIDGNKLNNHVSNLEMVTPKQNMEHAMRTGLLPRPVGELSTSARLTWGQVAEIRKLYESASLTQSDLSRLYKVTRANIFNIIHHKTWKLTKPMVL